MVCTLPKGHGRGYQYEAITYPLARQRDRSSSPWSHRVSLSAPLMESKRENGIYEKYGAPQHKSENLVGHVDNPLSSHRNLIMMSLVPPKHSESTPAVSSNNLLFDTLSESHEYSFPPRVLNRFVPHDSEGLSPQTYDQTIPETKSPTNLPDIRRLGMDGDSSFEKALRPPSRPPGPSPGPGPGPGPSLSTSFRPPPARLPGPYPSPSIRPFTSRPVTPVEPSPRPPFNPPGPSFSRGLAVNSQIQARMLSDKEWTRIKSLRAEIWSLRSRVHEKQKVLREKQDAKSEADNIYFQNVRMHRLGMAYGNQGTSKEQKTMEELFQDCETARDEYGPLEYDCTMLENHLGIREYELQKLEEKLYDRQIELPSSQVNELDTDLHSSISSTYSESEMGLQLYPLVSEYRSKLGDVEILRERLDGHQEEKDILEEEKEKRQRVNLELAQEDETWLDNYSSIENDLLSQIKAAEDEAENLRQECFSRGLVDEEGEPTDFESQERQAFINDEADAGSETSEYIEP